MRTRCNSNEGAGNVKQEQPRAVASQQRKSDDEDIGRARQGVVSHTLDVSDYNSHGHAQGHQNGHPMPRSDTHLQHGAFVPQDMYANTTKDCGAHGTGARSHP